MGAEKALVLFSLLPAASPFLTAPLQSTRRWPAAAPLKAENVDLCAVPGLEPFVVGPMLELSGGSGAAPLMAANEELPPALTAADKLLALFDAGMIPKDQMAAYYDALAAAEAAVEAERAAAEAAAAAAADVIFPSFAAPSIPRVLASRRPWDAAMALATALSGAATAAFLDLTAPAPLPEAAGPAAFLLGAIAGAAAVSRDDFLGVAARWVGETFLGAITSAVRSAVAAAGGAATSAGGAVAAAVEEAAVTAVNAPARAISQGASGVAEGLAAAPGAAVSMLWGGAVAAADGAASSARQAAAAAVSAAVDSAVTAATAAPRAALESVSRLPAEVAAAATAAVGGQRQQQPVAAAAAAAAAAPAAAVQEPPPLSAAEQQEIEELAAVRDKLVLLRASLARFEATKSRLAADGKGLAKALELSRSPDGEVPAAAAAVAPAVAAAPAAAAMPKRVNGAAYGSVNGALGKSAVNGAAANGAVDGAVSSETMGERSQAAAAPKASPARRKTAVATADVLRRARAVTRSAVSVGGEA